MAEPPALTFGALDGSPPAAGALQFGALEATSLVDALVAGWQQSATGLAVRGKLPDVHLPQHDLSGRGILNRSAANLVGVIADLPPAIVGAVGGAALGSAVSPGVGTTLGAGAGALGLPSAMRGALIQAYRQGGVNTFDEALDIIKAFLVEGGKGAALGAITAGAGRFVGQAVRGSTNAAVRNVAPVASQVAVLGSLGPALHGQVPGVQDFLDAAIIVGGMHAATATAGKLMTIYAKTGVPPAEVAAEVARNPVLKEEIARMSADDIGGLKAVPKTYEALAASENAKAAIPMPPTPEMLARISEFTARPFPEQNPAPGTPGMVNFRYINTAAEVELATARLSELMAPEVAAQRRGTVSHAETLREAQAKLAEILNVSPEHVPLARKPGDAVNPAELEARRILSIESVRELKERRDEVVAAARDGTLTERDAADFYLHFQRTGAILSQFTGAASEAGRTLNILRRVSEAKEEFAAVKEILEQSGKGKSLIEQAETMANALKGADDAAGLSAAVQKAIKVGWFRKFVEVWKAGLVSGIGTHEANLLGNTMTNFVTQLAERNVAAVIGETRHALTGSKDYVSFRENAAFYAGAVKGSLDALKIAGRIIADENVSPSILDVRSPSKVDQPIAAIGGMAGRAARVPFRTLQAEDAIFKVTVEHGELRGQAVRVALNEGLDPRSDAFKMRVLELEKNPIEPQIEAAIRAGQEATFTTPLGPTGQVMEAFLRSKWGQLGEIPLPFRRTPINITKWMSYRLPLLGIFTPKMIGDFKAGGARRDLAIARQITGLGLGLLTWELFADGAITGGFHSLTPEERQAKFNNDEQPYSVQIGKKWVSYARLEPVATILSIVADIAELSKNADKVDDRDALVATSAALFGNALISKTYMKGLNDAFRGLTQPQIYGPRWYQSLVGSMVPGFLSQIARTIDPHEREVRTVLEAVKNRLPWLREQLVQRVNPVTGGPVVNRAAGDVPSPFLVSTPGTDPVAAEAARLGFSPGKQAKTLLVGGRAVGGKLRLKEDEIHSITELTGKFGHDQMMMLVGSPGWKSIPDPLKMSMFRQAFASARRLAIIQSIDPDKRADVLNAALQALLPSE